MKFDPPELFRFEKRKGFFCQVIKEDRTKCLGRGKGRQYLPMNDKEIKLLKVIDLHYWMYFIDDSIFIFFQDFYKDNNIALEKLLVRLNYRVPSWLYQELSSG